MRVLGLDIGSSVVKGCLFEMTGLEPPQLVEQYSVDAPLTRPGPERAEHPLGELESAVQEVLSQTPSGCQIGVACAMHGLVLLDEDGEALGDAISWADGRSVDQAHRLRLRDPQAHQRTGTPIHPMAWPAKLAWLREEDPELWRRTASVTDLKSYLLGRLTGQPCPVDISSASGTGLWNNEEKSWDDRLRQALKLDQIQLPAVASPRYTMDWQGRTLHLGAADGPLSNLGLGATSGDRIAVSLGTSGAVRRMVRERRDVPNELFLYALDGESWVEGGAISNGSVVLDWLRQHKEMSHQELLELVAQAPPGAGGLLVFPYFFGERAPHWLPGTRSQIVGWSFEHDFCHLVRGCLEGVGYCLTRLLRLLGGSSEPLRCSGGMFASPVWCQLLADISGCTLSISPVAQATALGAALMTLTDYHERAELLPAGELFEPDSDLHEHYQILFDQWQAWERS